MERGGTGSALVTVRRDGQEFARQQVQADTPFSIDVRVEHGGANVVELEVEGLPDELTLANNRAVFRSKASVRNCGCCWSPASLIRASGLGATS